MAYAGQYDYRRAGTSRTNTPHVPAKNHRPRQQQQSTSHGLETETRFQQQQGYSNQANYDNYGPTTYNASYGDRTMSSRQQQGHENPEYHNVENGSTNVDDGRSRTPGREPGLVGRAYGKVKDFVMGNKSTTSSTFSEGSSNTFKIGRDVNVLANPGKPLIDKAEDLKCSQMKVIQPAEPTGQYMKDVLISWTNPKPKYCKIARLQFTVRNDVGYVWGKKNLHPTDTKLKIPDKTIECGCNYYAYITTMVQRDYGDYETYDTDETVFHTRPGRPTCLRLECTEYAVDVHWAPCSGAEKFGISLLDDQTKRKLDYQETHGSTHSCTFKIDKNRGVYLGKHYSFEVVAIREKWRNKSEKRLFLGSQNSPQSMKAELNAESNKVLLSWRKPESSYGLLSDTYVVEVVPEGGEPQEQPKTTNTTMDITDLKGGTSYFFRVATLVGNAKSLWSLSNTIKTEACTIKVENFRLETNDEDPSQCINCFWDSVEGAVGYKIRYKRPGNSTTVVTLDKVATEYAVKDLLPNTEYQVSIKAKDGKGYGPYIEEERKSTGLGRPLDVKLKVVDGNSMNVTFREAPLATSHKVALRTDGEDESYFTVPLGGSKRFNALLWNKKYHVTVTADYDGCEGGQLTETILTAPAAPSSRAIEVEIDRDNPTSVFTISIPIAENCHRYQAKATCLDSDEEEEKNISEMSVDKDTGLAVLKYRCLHEGAMFDIRIRAKNDTGYGKWSEQKLKKTAPKKVENPTMRFEDGKLVAEWKNARHTSGNHLVLFENETKIVEKSPKHPSPFVLHEEPIHGFEYFYVIDPTNESGRGPETRSNTVLIPLDPPQSLTMKDAFEHVKFAWTPSTGMQSALISFSNSDLNEIVNTTNNKEWASPPVTPGEVYEFKVWAKNGDARSKKYLSKTFVTAPREVRVKRNKIRPESRLDVQIDSSHPGPFLLSWRDTAGRKESVGIFGPDFTIENLAPATEYECGVACVYGESKERKSAWFFTNPVMTLPDRVRGVQFIDGKPDGAKTLQWESCGNDAVGYTITWSKDYNPFKPIKTGNTFCNFQHLKPGIYRFSVSAGGGKNSEQCLEIIPKPPAMDVNVLSPKRIRLTFEPSTDVEKHFVLLKSDGVERRFETEANQLELAQNEFPFEKGVKYTVVAMAEWRNIRSFPSKSHDFVMGIENPQKLECELTHPDPQRPVKFTWKNSEEMRSAKVQIRDLQNKVVVEESTNKSWWEYWGLKPNKTYEFMLWPGDGNRFFYDNYIRHKCTTAPNQPRYVLIYRYLKPHRRNLVIEIISDYKGPFVIRITDTSGNKKHEDIETRKKRLKVESMNPGIAYVVFVRCKFGDYLTPETCSFGDGDYSSSRIPISVYRDKSRFEYSDTM